MPKAIIEVKDLKLDVSKSGGSSPVLNIKLYIIPLTVQICDSRLSYDQSSCYNQMEGLLNSDLSGSAIMEKNSAPFICEDLSVACEFGHDR